MRIYLIDYIGEHCGMHYYMSSFKQVLKSIQGVDVEIISNFSCENKKPLLKNHYKGNKIKKVFALLFNYFVVNKFINRHLEDVIIYLSYGNSIDVPFINIVSRAPHHIIDIHEAIAQNVDTNKSLKNTFKKLYQTKVKSVISHSKRTDDFLNLYGYKNTILTVPHFKYNFPQFYSVENVPKELKESIDPTRLNLLFFGNLNTNKGIDILLSALNLLSMEDSRLLNIIIAGKDYDGAVNLIEPREDLSIYFFKRHITDDELCFLYQNVDYVLLPYRKTSQSGILEMAFYFKTNYRFGHSIFS